MKIKLVYRLSFLYSILLFLLFLKIRQISALKSVNRFRSKIRQFHSVSNFRPANIKIYHEPYPRYEISTPAHPVDP